MQLRSGAKQRTKHYWGGGRWILDVGGYPDFTTHGKERPDSANLLRGHSDFANTN